MKTEKIKKSISISAPAEKVWEVLTDDQYTRMWYAEFSEGTYAETDWKEGSKAVFKDTKGNGLVGKIVLNRPPEALSVEYEGIVNAHVEDYKSSEAQQIRGGHENYFLTESDGITMLSIESDMSPEYIEPMSLMWDKALLKIKDLSEG